MFWKDPPEISGKTGFQKDRTAAQCRELSSVFSGDLDGWDGGQVGERAKRREYVYAYN